MLLKTREPQPDQFAVQLPHRTRSRLGLEHPCWVVAQEVNVSMFGPGPNIRRTPDGAAVYGLPGRLMTAIKTEFVAALGARSLTTIARAI